MAANTWELDRDIFVARYQGNMAEVERLTLELDAVRAACSHRESPEVAGRCYECGATGWKGPSVKKTAAYPALVAERARRKDTGT